MSDEPNKTFVTRTKALIAAAKVRTAGGISWNVFGDIVFAFLEIAVDQARYLAMEGYAKKAEVLDAVSLLIDTISIPLPWYLMWLKPYAKRAILGLADGAIEVIYSRIKKEVPIEVPGNPKLAS